MKAISKVLASIFMLSCSKLAHSPTLNMGSSHSHAKPKSHLEAMLDERNMAALDSLMAQCGKQCYDECYDELMRMPSLHTIERLWKTNGFQFNFAQNEQKRLKQEHNEKFLRENQKNNGGLNLSSNCFLQDLAAEKFCWSYIQASAKNSGGHPKALSRAEQSVKALEEHLPDFTHLEGYVKKGFIPVSDEATGKVVMQPIPKPVQERLRTISPTNLLPEARAAYNNLDLAISIFKKQASVFHYDAGNVQIEKLKELLVENIDHIYSENKKDYRPILDEASIASFEANLSLLHNPSFNYKHLIQFSRFYQENLPLFHNQFLDYRTWSVLFPLESPLAIAVYSKSTKVLAGLVKFLEYSNIKVSMNTKALFGLSPLEYAVVSGHKEMVKLLIRMAPIVGNGTPLNFDRALAMAILVSNGIRSEMVEILLNAKGN